MPDRKMFWRILRRLFGAQRGRLLVILLALGSGAALTAALLNLEVDAKSRLTREFRAFGANVIVAPRQNNAATADSTLDESVVKKVREFAAPPHSTAIAYLYLVADVSAPGVRQPIKVVVSGNQPMFQSAVLHGSRDGVPVCSVGAKAAEQLHLRAGEELHLSSFGREEKCSSETASPRGDETDSQIGIPLQAAQRLVAMPGKISLAQLSIPGTPREIETYIAALARTIPEAEVQGLRQFTGGESKIYNRISGLLTATVALVLALTSLCVMAAMTNVAMERRSDVGLMKAIGGATRRVLRLFWAEAALLGLAGGITGAAAGLALSIWLGKAVFGVAARPRLIVYPVSVVLTIIVSIISAYPLRRLANISPASVFRGEG